MDKVYLMLGRYGDIINILPAIEYESKKNNYKPKLIIAKEYKDLVEGLSYLEPITWEGDFKECIKAYYWAVKNFPNEKVINCSVYGIGYKFNRKCNSFQRESWSFSQCKIPFGQLKLNFDNRNKEREKQLLEKLNLTEEKNKIIVTALNGISSPFNYKNELLDYLIKELSEYRIIDISDLKAEKIIDILSIYEKADYFITIDSATLQLTKAVSNLPVISLIDDSKDSWYHSEWNKNHILRIPYSKIKENLELIKNTIKNNINLLNRKIYFVSSYLEKNENILFAENTRLVESENHKGMWEFYYYQIDNHLPEIRKMVDYISDIANDNDILMICNSDICFVPGITDIIMGKIAFSDSIYFHRHDFAKLTEPLKNEIDISFGKWYCGSDCFVMTKKWWLKHRDEFPDMYFGRKMWDLVFRNMVKRSGGVEIHNAIYHTKHKSYWENEGINCTENIYNERFAKEWLAKYGGDWNDWSINPNKLKYK